MLGGGDVQPQRRHPPSGNRGNSTAGNHRNPEPERPAPLPAGETGEVLISGQTVTRGFLGRPEATAETIKDGWLHTGDLGFLDEDGY